MIRAGAKQVTNTRSHKPTPTPTIKVRVALIRDSRIPQGEETNVICHGTAIDYVRTVSKYS